MEVRSTFGSRLLSTLFPGIEMPRTNNGIRYNNSSVRDDTNQSNCKDRLSDAIKNLFLTATVRMHLREGGRLESEAHSLLPLNPSREILSDASTM